MRKLRDVADAEEVAARVINTRLTMLARLALAVARVAVLDLIAVAMPTLGLDTENVFDTRLVILARLGELAERVAFARRVIEATEPDAASLAVVIVRVTVARFALATARVLLLNLVIVARFALETDRVVVMDFNSVATFVLAPDFTNCARLVSVARLGLDAVYATRRALIVASVADAELVAVNVRELDLVIDASPADAVVLVDATVRDKALAEFEAAESARVVALDRLAVALLAAEKARSATRMIASVATLGLAAVLVALTTREMDATAELLDARMIAACLMTKAILADAAAKETNRVLIT
jgi:hypothetical protein